MRFEIRAALRNHLIIPEFTITAHRDRVTYLDTEESVERMIAHFSAERLRLAEVWVFCHRTHKTYIRFLLWRHGIRVNRWICSCVYDPLSHQKWTQNALRCNIEKFVRGFTYLVRGKFRNPDKKGSQ